jgi:hypothetical protein
MKRFSTFAGAGLVLAFAATLAWAAVQAKPVNRKCPLKPDSRVDPKITLTHNGKVIGFCCTDCVDKWKKNPAGYASAVKEDANIPIEPEGFTDAKAALEAAQGGGYLCVLFFSDKGAASTALLKTICDTSLEEAFANCAYANVEFKKDNAEAKKLGVTAAGTLVLVDARPKEPKVLKTLASATPAVLKKEMQDAAKKMEENK